MAIRMMEARAVPLTRAVATTHATLASMPGEREVKPVRLKFLNGLLQDGKFTGPNWHQGRCLADGVLYRLDGQHSSHMLAELDAEEFPTDLLATLVMWEFDSMDDAADLFNSFNNPRSARTNEDVMGVYRATVPELAHLSRKFLIHVADGVHERENQKHDDGAEDALPPYGPRTRGLYFQHDASVVAAIWLAQFQGTKHQRFLSYPAIVAEMLHHHEINVALATTFWTYVFRENHPDVAHETRELTDLYRAFTTPRAQRTPQFRAKAAKAWKQFLKSQAAVAPSQLPDDPTPISVREALRAANAASESSAAPA